MGLRVEVVKNLKAATRALSRKAFRICILDYALPDGFSTTIIPLIKEKLPEARIVGISSLDVERKFLAAGADMFVRKPFKVVPFAKAVKEMAEGEWMRGGETSLEAMEDG